MVIVLSSGGINSKWAVLSCTIIAFSERFVVGFLSSVCLRVILRKPSNKRPRYNRSRVQVSTGSSSARNVASL